MKTRKFKIGEPVVHHSMQTCIHGYYREHKKLYVIEKEDGWMGWCILDSEEVIPGNLIKKNRRYTLAYENELWAVGKSLPVKA